MNDARDDNPRLLRLIGPGARRLQRCTQCGILCSEGEPNPASPNFRIAPHTQTCYGCQWANESTRRRARGEAARTWAAFCERATARPVVLGY